MSARLAELGTWRSGGTPPKDRDELWGGGFPWISTRDLKLHELSSSTETITEAAAQRFSTTVPAGSVLIATRGMALARRLPVALVTRPVAFNQDIKAIEPDRRVWPKYLLYALLAFEDQLLALTDEAAHGTKRLDTDLLRAFRIPCPPLAKQRRVGDFLDAETGLIDALLSARARQRELLSERRRAKVLAAVVGDLADGIGRWCTTSDVPKLSTLPREWRLVSVGSKFDVQLGKMLNADRAAEAGADGAAPYLRNVNVQWGRVDTQELKWMYFDDADRSKFALKRGDLLVCEGGEIGRCALWDSDRDDCFFQKALMRVRPAGADSAQWLALCLTALADAGVLAAGTDRSTIDHLPAKKLRALRVPLPPLEVQRELVSRSAEDDRRSKGAIAAINCQIDLLRERRQALITAAVTGKLQIPAAPIASATP